MKKTLALLTLSSTLVGCVAPLTKQQAQALSTDLKQQPIALLTDGCLMQQESEQTYIIREQSAFAGIEVANIITAELLSHGVTISQKYSPLSCSFMSEQKLAEYSQKRTFYDVASPVRMPLVATDEPLQDLYPALLRLNHSVFANTSIQENNGLRLNPRYKSKDINLNAYEIQQLKQQLGTSKIVLAHLVGYKPSSTMKAAGLAVTALSIALQAPMTGMYKETQYFLVTYIDLDTKKVVWAKQQPFEGTLFTPGRVSIATKDVLHPLFK